MCSMVNIAELCHIRFWYSVRFLNIFLFFGSFLIVCYIFEVQVAHSFSDCSKLQKALIKCSLWSLYLFHLQHPHGCMIAICAPDNLFTFMPMSHGHMVTISYLHCQLSTCKANGEADRRSQMVIVWCPRLTTCDDSLNSSSWKCQNCCH